MAFKHFSDKIGFMQINMGAHIDETLSLLEGYMKILFLKRGNVLIDFSNYHITSDTLFFVNHSQIFELKDDGELEGILLYYSRDFYCVEINDSEVACHGILYNNVYEIPSIELNEEESLSIQSIFNNIQFESENVDAANEEMLQLLLKQLIIKGTRIWKIKHNLNDNGNNQELDFVRKFSQLVEQNFKTSHHISDYADFLFVTPKNLNKKITQFGYLSPKQIVMERIILEAKRLLAHSVLTVKEIGYELGYEDDAYFVRIFTKHCGQSPLQFRKQYIALR
ncbi:AraC family transcriptional regulator [Chryseobacterium culicis]|uniref:AraC family transcriptional regulator n=1 Tax=Chryseobacterium culicis TaxID=680127 RepID=A0A2S9CXB9_CHRCI|nr:AraC family transcriptional regulator [Chryseobacterium culicis]PRB85111.1 AraC family transcriptional regulator [Chryseobacterium culicis]PRB91165.1 AraC family transcriptional regulator [Chryseobacterium culicis]